MKHTSPAISTPVRVSYFLSSLLGIGVCGLVAQAPAQASLSLSVSQSGGDVLVIGSGSADISALISDGSSATWTNVFTDSQIYAGPDAFSDGSVGLWRGLSGPTVFGSNGAVTENPRSGTGELFGILANDGYGTTKLVLPATYTSGSVLTGSSRFTGLTLADLGLTPGQRTVWNWGSGASADWLEVVVDASGPSPATVPSPIPLCGIAMAFHSCSRLRRRIRSSKS
jgi:hypothetical protein